MRRFALLVAGLALIAGVAATVSGGGTQVEARWVITDLGTLGGRESTAVAINEHGQVVGYSETKAKDREGFAVVHAFSWQDGRMHDLGTLGGRMNSTSAVAINNRGQVIGSSTGLGGSYQAFLWQGGKIAAIGTNNEDGVAINARGQIILEDANSHAFLWQDGRATDLGSLGGGGTWVEAMNDRGQVVGESDLGGTSARAFLWQNGRMKRLAIPGSEAWALNERNEIVGWTDAGHGTQHAVLWTRGRMRDLGSLRENSYAYDINERGQVVGWSGVAPGLQHAFLWQNGRMMDLLPGKAFSRAYAINGNGEVAGDIGNRPTMDSPVAAFVWRAGKLVRLVTLGGSESGVGEEGELRPSQHAINNHDQIVGWAKTKGGTIHAVLWTLKR